MKSQVVLSVHKKSTQEKTTSIGIHISSGCPNNLKQQEWILSQFWKLEVHNPDVSRAVLPSKALEESPSLLPFGFGWSLAALGAPWPERASLQSLPLSSVMFSLCVCLSAYGILISVCVPKFPSSYKRYPVMRFGLTLIQYDRLLT